jgi:hypothetical protein
MEPLTIGQKFAFSCVVLFVVALTVTPFFFNSNSGKDKTLSFQNETVSGLIAR